MSAPGTHSLSCPTFVGKPCDCSINQSDQPSPEVNSQIPVVDRVIDFLEQRADMGEKKYGTKLQPHNGRDALKDAFEEAVDLVMYLGQAILERDEHL